MRLSAVSVVILLAGAAFPVLPIALADHGSGDYRQPVVGSAFYLPTSKVQKVLVVPPTFGQVLNGNGVLNDGDLDELDPHANTYLRAIEDSLQMWRDAVGTFGDPWFTAGFGIDHYVLGRDEVPEDVLADADVVITTDAYKGPILGAAFRGLMIPDQACTIHNSVFGTVPLSFTYEDMFHVNAHEFGHCLGLSHTEHPVEDIMYASYPHTVGTADNPLTCVSNLNVRGVQLAFAPLFNRPGGTMATVPVDDYAWYGCA